MHLIDYGRLVKDGEMKISDSTKDGNKLKNRYVFVFDKVMLICKSLRVSSVLLLRWSEQKSLFVLICCGAPGCH